MGPFRHLMAWYLVVDVLFTAGYVALLLLIMKATGRRDALFVIGTVAVILLGFVDLMENAAAAEVVWAAKQLALVLFFTTLKWVLVGACLFIVLLRIVVPIAETKLTGHPRTVHAAGWPVPEGPYITKGSPTFRSS